MFGPEYIPAAYLEERLAAEKAKRDEEEKRQQEQAQAAKQHHAPGQPTPSSLSSVFAQRPQPSRAGSSTVLGTIYQSLAKSKAGGTSTPTSASSSRGQTPVPEMSDEEKKAFDEKWREIDMLNMPKWH